MVSKTWRAITLSTPDIWSTVRLRTYFLRPWVSSNWGRKLSEHATLSKALPLDIQIASDTHLAKYAEGIDQLMPIAKRVRSIGVRMKDAARELPRAATCMRRLTLLLNPQEVSFSGSNYPSGSRSRPIDDVLSLRILLQLSPQLRRLSLSNLSQNDGSEEDYGFLLKHAELSSPTMQCLSVVRLENVGRFTAALVLTITVPLLEILAIKLVAPEDTRSNTSPELTELAHAYPVGPRFPALRTLVLHGFHLRSDVTAFLSQAPDAEEVILHPPPPQPDHDSGDQDHPVSAAFTSLGSLRSYTAEALVQWAKPSQERKRRRVVLEDIRLEDVPESQLKDYMENLVAIQSILEEPKLILDFREKRGMNFRRILNELGA